MVAEHPVEEGFVAAKTKGFENFTCAKCIVEALVASGVRCNVEWSVIGCEEIGKMSIAANTAHSVLVLSQFFVKVANQQDLVLLCFLSLRRKALRSLRKYF
jgi:hypothetical protein